MKKDLVENKELREELIGKVEVLDTVENLLLLDESEMVTADMVASYYGEDVDISNREVALFSKRDVLRVGMLSGDSAVAKELRTQLLNIVEVVNETNSEMLVQEIDKEKQLLMNIMFAKDDMEREIAVNEHIKYMERYKSDVE